MSFSYPLTMMLVTLVGLTILNFPIGLAMIGSGVLYLLLSHGDMGLVTAQVMSNVAENFLILAVPLFIFAAKVMNTGSVTDRLLNFIIALVGRFRGGLGHVNIVTSIIFAGMSGSGVADAAGVGTVLQRMMTRDGRYPAGFAAALSAASSTIGPIIPPSIPMVLYALVSGTSVGALFLAGIIPGLLMGLTLAVAVYVISLRRGYPVEAAVPLKDLPGLFVRAFLPLLTPVILLGGIYSGVFTPTEAAAVAAFYAIILTVGVYRDLGLRGFYNVVVETARESAAVMIILGGAYLFNYIVTVERVPQAIGVQLNSLEVSNAVFLLIVMGIFILLGAFLDGSALLLVAVPLMLPAVQANKINLVYFGVLVTINVMIGGITPPYGLLLFVLNKLTGTPLGAIIREVWPFLLALIVALIIMVFVPGLVMWLPEMLGYR